MSLTIPPQKPRRPKFQTKTDGKGGVFWHTQGSGKSLSMVFYAHLLQEALDSPTIVVMTDRIDLDDQLYAQFSKCAAFLRQTPVQAESKVHLKELLDGRTANGIIFTTMFKFEEREEPLSTRRNIVVMADEAHRGQYGMDERIVMSENEKGETEARIVVGNARIIRDALPNATFIGFTGTPVSSKDRNTREVFGDYIDIYDMTQAVEDGATRPVYYESRVIHLKLDENTLALIDSTYDILEQQASAETIAKSKKMLGQMESVLGADSTIASLVDDIVTHYETNRANLLTGKAGENFSLFDPAVLDEISHMKQKNIAVEILKKLLAEQVSIYKRTNVVQSAKFSEMITRIMNAYYNGHISNDEVIKELLEAAEMIAKAHQAGDALGLTQEELAFYDALTKPQAIKDFYENDVLVQMTRELTEMLRKNRTIDWQKKETARATMRKMVKRLLKKYKYPPEQCEDAINTVISQCEMWTDNAPPIRSMHSIIGICFHSDAIPNRPQFLPDFFLQRMGLCEQFR